MNYERMDELVYSAQSGDDEAFAKIFEDYWNTTYYYCFRHLRNKEDAEDATQEVFMILYRRIKSVKHPKMLSRHIKWLIAEVCQNYKNKTTINFEEILLLEEFQDKIIEDNEEFIPHEMLERKEFSDEMINLIGDLPKKQQEVIMLYYFNEFSCEEIAELTGSNSSTIRTRLQNARNKLKTKIEKSVKNENSEMLSATPVLTQLFHDDMKRVVDPKHEERLWNRINQDILNTPTGLQAEHTKVIKPNTTSEDERCNEHGDCDSKYMHYNRSCKLLQ